MKENETYKIDFFSKIKTNSKSNSDKAINKMVSEVLSRINDCALRENTVASIQQTQKFLEQKINEKFSHVKFHMQNLDGKIENADKNLNMKIQEIKKKTLGKITGKSD